MRAEPVSSATCRQISLSRSWSLQAGRTSASHCVLCWGRESWAAQSCGSHKQTPRAQWRCSIKASPYPHPLPRPFIVIPFIQSLSNPRPPSKFSFSMSWAPPVYTPTGFPPHSCHGWAGGCRQPAHPGTMLDCHLPQRQRHPWGRKDLAVLIPLGVLESISSTINKGISGSARLCYRTCMRQSSLGLWGCSGPCPAAPGESRVPHTSPITAPSSGFPWVILSQVLTKFCGHYCHPHPPKKV